MAVAAGAFLAVSSAVAPAAADTPNIESHITTGSDGVEYKVTTAVDGKPLVDQQGDPAPIREPLAAAPIRETDCDSRSKPVHIRYGNWLLPKDKCYSSPGTKTVAMSGVDWLHGGRWNGSVYYKTATACVVRPFASGERLNFSNDTLCVLSIEY
ncbi:hypothetical protein GCM10009799_14400 [Nocardiopsis rhodophaea]|uniref:Secreted protein n=2 Tax=Nocardiopsis rhodophaea TaxID=280238 RepID=A0ABN2SNR7_9ACTN